MALSCFKLKEPSDINGNGDSSDDETADLRINSSDANVLTNFNPDLKVPSVGQLEPIDTTRSNSLNRSPMTAKIVNNAQSGRLRTIAAFRHAGFTTSAFSACVSQANVKKKHETGPELYVVPPSVMGSLDASVVHVTREQGTQDDTFDAQPILSNGSRGHVLSCLVRSQSDSTCLSLKSLQKGSNPSLLTDSHAGQACLDEARPSALMHQCGSPTSNVDMATESGLHSSSSDLDSTGFRMPVLEICTDRPSESDAYLPAGVTYSSSSLSSVPQVVTQFQKTNSTRSQTANTRVYQLVCRDGVQRYELVSSDNRLDLNSSFVYSEESPTPSCVPSRLSAKPRHTLVSVEHNDPSTSFAATQRIKAGPHKSGSIYPNNPAFISSPNSLNYVQSTGATSTSSSTHPATGVIQSVSGSSVGRDRSMYHRPVVDAQALMKRDTPTAPVPSRKQRTTSPPTMLPPSSTASERNERPTPSSNMTSADRQRFCSLWPNTTAGQSRALHHTMVYGEGDSGGKNNRGARDPGSPHLLNQSGGNPVPSSRQTERTVHQKATVVRAPANGLSTLDSMATTSQQGRLSPYHFSSSSTQSSGVPYHQDMGVVDSGSRMTIVELRSITERQRQQLTRQSQQLQSKEERLAWLRSLRMRASGDTSSQLEFPLPGSDLTREQEIRLHKLRGYRGQTEHTRLLNEELAKEIDHFSQSLSSKELELDTCRRRAQEAQRVLSLIRTCHVCLSSTVRTPRSRTHSTPDADVAASGSASELDKPLDLLSVQLPFTTERDTKRWRDGLLEADRLDKQMSLALSHSHSRRGPAPIVDSNASNSPNTRPHKTSVAILPMTNVCSKPVSTTVPNESWQVPLMSDPLPTTSGAQPSAFSSILSRASSPPTNRRSSLRMLLQATSSSAISLDPSVDGNSPDIMITPFKRIKTPPRFASRAAINDTYMRRICRDSVEKYKRTANEIYRAKLDHMMAKPTSLTSSESDKALPTPEPGEVVVTRTLKNTDASSGRRLPCVSPMESLSSSSSSSLELVGLDQTSNKESKKPLALSPTDEETKQSTGDVDSGIGASDDTGQSDPALLLAKSGGRTGDMATPTSTAIVLVEDTAWTEGSLSNTSALSSGTRPLKSILRRLPKTRGSESKPVIGLTTTKPASLIVVAESSGLTNLSSQPASSRSVRFHPLALLLDAALEGDLELVKKVAAEVSDVSEPNDEGITALHNAVCAGRTDIAEFLVRSAGADVNAGDTDGWTPLHCAASCANLPLARLLVEHGASLHARTLSDQETPLEKCDQGEDEADCEEYLYFQQDRLGSAASGLVYALFPRGLEAAGPGSPDSHLESDELAVRPNERLTILDRQPGEPEWMLAERSDGTGGLIPRSHISCYPLVRVPPASHPIPIVPTRSRRFEFLDEADEGQEVDGDDVDNAAATPGLDGKQTTGSHLTVEDDSRIAPTSPSVVVEVDVAPSISCSPAVDSESIVLETVCSSQMESSLVAGGKSAVVENSALHKEDFLSDALEAKTAV